MANYFWHKKEGPLPLQIILSKGMVVETICKIQG